MTMHEDLRSDQAVDFDELLADPAVAQATEDAETRLDLLDELVALRKSSHLTQKQVAEAMETTQSTVSEFENGGEDPYLSTLQRYARAVGAKLSVHVQRDACVPTVAPMTVRQEFRVTINSAPSQVPMSDYIATYAQLGTMGRRSSYAQAA